MKPLTLAEAAQFLRMSKSSLYQRKDIPRYRLPHSRTWLYDQNELEALLKQEVVSGQDQPASQMTTEGSVPMKDLGVVDISTQRVYHRNARYR